MAWYVAPYTDETYRAARPAWGLVWPVWPWWGAATAFLFLAAFVQLLNFINDIIVMLTGERIDPQGVETKLVPSRNLADCVRILILVLFPQVTLWLLHAG